MKNFGFTLAEVLITLGIIGIVAALTIPTLIANTKGKQFAAQYKKTVSTLNQAIRLNKTNYGWDFSEIDSYCGSDQALTSQVLNVENPENIMSRCAWLNGSLKGITWYNIFAYEDDEPENGIYKAVYSDAIMNTDYGEAVYHGDAVSLTLADGTLFSFNWAPDTPCTKEHKCYGIIDVNGKAKPNKEVKCSGNVETSLMPATPCIVQNSEVTDIFPVAYYDMTIEPATNAAAYVLKNAK